MSRHTSTAITPGLRARTDPCAVRHQPGQAMPSTQSPNRSPLWLALHLVQLPFEAAGVPAGGPAAVIFERHGQAHWVTVANDAAIRAGIQPLMALAAARALAPHLRAFPRDRVSEQQTLKERAVEAMRWTPSVSIAEDGLLMEITGSLRLYGGLQQLISLVRNWIDTKTPCFQIALTPTPASAILCARVGRELYITEREKARGSLAFQINNVADILNKIRDFSGPTLQLKSTDDDDDTGSGVLLEQDEELDETELEPDELIDLIKDSTCGEVVWGELNSIEFEQGLLFVNAPRELHVEIQGVLSSLRKDSDIFVMISFPPL